MSKTNVSKEYLDFIKSKEKKHISSGFSVELNKINENAFNWQKRTIQIALRKGRFALFFDCGLGKTLMQLEWARIVSEKEEKPVLILSPLAVVDQTIREGKKFNIKVEKLNTLIDNPINSLEGIFITNFDQLKNIDTSLFCGIVLDESSILKGKDGKLSSLIIESFKYHRYKLACTATPSPNDHMELGQHSEFLGAMSYLEMLAMYFVHDGGETQKWRLRKHAQDDFWKYVCTWSMSLDNPCRIDNCITGYNLPGINYIEHQIKVENNTNTLFPDVAVSATDLHKDLKRTFEKRMLKTSSIVNESSDQWIVWCLRNDEAKYLSSIIKDSVNVQGSDSAQFKSDKLNGFAKGEFKVLITKLSIASFGMNFQNCHNQIFASYDFKFEPFYQGVRRSYRFGQNNEVNIHIMIPESQKNVRKTILKKEKQHKERIEEMSLYSSNTDYSIFKNKKMKQQPVISDRYKLFNGDCVEESKNIKDNEVDLIVFSPPFAELYVYSDDPKDMGNVSDYEQFKEHFKFLIPELKRVLKPGRICAVHCMDLPIQKGKEGFIGLRDFSGMIEQMFTAEGFIYHARTTIWKNPVTEMQRTKALGLLHKQIKKDSSMSRVGIPDYILFFRNEGENKIPITHQDSDPARPDYLPVDLWQKYASPVWMDVDYSRTLQYRSARDNNDEKHICPLQLDTIERIIHLYSNEGEVVMSPFGGIGSEGYSALKLNRNSISIELKKSYFDVNVKNHIAAIEESKMLTLF